MQPATFSLRQLVQLRNAPNRWAYALSASFCIAAPVVVGWIAGDVAAGVIASFGAFTALYGADRPYRNRAIKLATIAVSLGCAVAVGAWSKQFGIFGIAAVVLIAMGATFFCNALGIRPPGAYLFALAGALGHGLPSQQLHWWQAGLLVLAGGGISTIVRLMGGLADPRAPERTAVASAGKAVAQFVKVRPRPINLTAAAAVSKLLVVNLRQWLQSIDDGGLRDRAQRRIATQATRERPDGCAKFEAPQHFGRLLKWVL